MKSKIEGGSMELHGFAKRITRMKVKLQVSKKMMELYEVVEL